MIKLDSYRLVGSNDGEFKTLTFKGEDDNDIDFTFPLNRKPYIELRGTFDIDDVLEAITLVKSGKITVEL